MCTTIKRKKSNASLCVKCGKCESHCPQGIAIRNELDSVRKELETPLYRAAAKFVKLFAKL